MAAYWKESLQNDPNFQTREDQSAIITIHNLLNNDTASELAASQITSSYENRLLEGVTSLWSLWRLICLAIIHPTTTHQNLETLADMLVHISNSPDVVANGRTVEENGREYWHDLPEFSFWFMEYTMSGFLVACYGLLCSILI